MSEMFICLAVCQTRELWKKTKETYAEILYAMKGPSSSFPRRMVGGSNPFYLKFGGKLTALERKRRFSTDIHS